MAGTNQNSTMQRYTVTFETTETDGVGSVLRAIADVNGDLSVKDVRSGDDEVVEISTTDLTETQRETLIRAVAAGYYMFPREVTLETLSKEFEISKSAVSQRLRKAEATIVQRVVAEIAPGVIAEAATEAAAEESPAAEEKSGRGAESAPEESRPGEQSDDVRPLRE